MKFVFAWALKLLLLAIAIGGQPWRIPDPRPFCELSAPEQRAQK